MSENKCLHFVGNKCHMGAQCKFQQRDDRHKCTIKGEIQSDVLTVRKINTYLIANEHMRLGNG